MQWMFYKSSWKTLQLQRDNKLKAVNNFAKNSFILVKSDST